MRRSRAWFSVAVGVAVVAAAPARAFAGEEAVATAVVTLIGTAGANEELGAVLSELLDRQGVKSEIESEDRFDPEALLSEGEHDARVRVFVVLHDEHQARLYFRSPLGKRFLLRKLSLRSGLDEIGRELIGQVVETSTVALLRSSAGISRDEASASLSEERAEAAPPERVAPPPPPAPAKKENARARPPVLAFAIGERNFVQWLGDGGPALGVGVEGALGAVFPSAWTVRGRLAGDYRVPERVARAGVDATTSSFALRAGVDGGKWFGSHGVLLGLAAGVDFDHAAANTAPASVKLSAASDSAAAMFRAELRYELSLGHFWATAAAFTDFSAVHTHYDFVEGRTTVRVVDLWAARPGISVTFGWSSFAADDTGGR